MVTRENYTHTHTHKATNIDTCPIVVHNNYFIKGTLWYWTIWERACAHSLK